MVTLTSDNGKLMHALNSVPFEGHSANLKSALQVAQVHNMISGYYSLIFTCSWY